ncbi:hypothetical protein GCM10027290_43880 [Micromonospora sonneratiae]
MSTSQYAERNAAMFRSVTEAERRGAPSKLISLGRTTLTTALLFPLSRADPIQTRLESDPTRTALTRPGFGSAQLANRRWNLRHASSQPATAQAAR